MLRNMSSSKGQLSKVWIDESLMDGFFAPVERFVGFVCGGSPIAEKHVVSFSVTFLCFIIVHVRNRLNMGSRCGSEA